MLIYFKIIVYSLPIFLHLRGDNINNIKIDREYAAKWYPEVEYLLNHGIRYSFVKEEGGVTVWKFTKTPQLFMHLSHFYETVYYK